MKPLWLCKSLGLLSSSQGQTRFSNECFSKSVGISTSNLKRCHHYFALLVYNIRILLVCDTKPFKVLLNSTLAYWIQKIFQKFTKPYSIMVLFISTIADAATEEDCMLNSNFDKFELYFVKSCAMSNWRETYLVL